MSLMLSSDAATDHGRVRLQELRAAERLVPLLRLTLRHTYGASALAGLRLTPSQATHALGLQHGLLMRTDAQGMALYAPQRALPSLWQAQRDEGCDYLLAWRLDCSEALFTLASTDDAPRHVLLRLATRRMNCIWQLGSATGNICCWVIGPAWLPAARSKT